MRAIKHTLTERFYTWEDATKLAQTDPEVNLTGDGPAFTPSDYLEQGEVAAEGEAAEKAESATTATIDPAAIPTPKPQAEVPRL
jgi:large subunit ribosomal protein L47